MSIVLFDSSISMVWLSLLGYLALFISTVSIVSIVSLVSIVSTVCAGGICSLRSEEVTVQQGLASTLPTWRFLTITSSSKPMATTASNWESIFYLGPGWPSKESQKVSRAPPALKVSTEKLKS